jgi:glyoxylase-like metal-dependent hydrolase (beta-lactamase superfamily II)
MLMPMKTALIGLAAAAVVGSAAEPQIYPRLTQIADGVYTYEQADPTKRGVAVNNLIVVTSEGVLVADGQGTVDNTKRLVDDIAALTTRPVRYVVVGSIHGDHRGGDAAFPSGVTFVKAKTDLTLGGREIHILFLGRAHTGTDLEVYLPREGIMYMSESFSNDIFPSLANGYPSEWVAALLRAEEMPVDIYVPAHSPQASAKLHTSRDDVRKYRAALETVVREGRRLHDAHVPGDEAVAGANFGDIGAWIRKPENAAAALKRVYMEIDGQLKPES